ncbi:hypothetical protein ABT332_13540 [Saccharomonospora azurea]|uniref:hypothetical protein n=1 Tax=Saccharomonospora azurea TaxID=40988 RepID=UPI003328BF0B
MDTTATFETYPYTRSHVDEPRPEQRGAWAFQAAFTANGPVTDSADDVFFPKATTYAAAQAEAEAANPRVTVWLVLP